MHSPEFPSFAMAVPEAARRAGVSRSFLYEEMSAGRLPFLKAGKRRLIMTEDLVHWLGSLRQGPPGANAAPRPSTSGR